MSSTLRWFKSSYSNDSGGNCVEVALCPHAIHIRDSKNSTGAVVTVSDAAWSAFLAAPATPLPKKM